MPAWPGGPCPECGDEMPPNLVHCQTCRALLNPDLEPDSIEIPAFQPLQEIECMVDVEPRGYYVSCPQCQQELRINRKYAGKKVQCKICGGQFDLYLQSSRTLAFYAQCPHCDQELRAAMKYLGTKVACKRCHGHIQLIGAG